MFYTGFNEFFCHILSDFYGLGNSPALGDQALKDITCS